MRPLGSGVVSRTASYPPAALHIVPHTQRVPDNEFDHHLVFLSFTGLAVMTLIYHQGAAGCTSRLTSPVQT